MLLAFFVAFLRVVFEWESCLEALWQDNAWKSITTDAPNVQCCALEESGTGTTPESKASVSISRIEDVDIDAQVDTSLFSETVSDATFCLHDSRVRRWCLPRRTVDLA